MSTGKCAVCFKATSQECATCHAVNYCGKEHQKEHWSEHRKVCYPYEIKYSSVSSPHVVATRDIKTNEVIVDETPLVVGPSYLNHQQLCPGCHRQGYSCKSRCPRCGWPICSQRCPGLTEPTRHGAECSLLSKIKSSLSLYTDDVLLPLRCLLLQKNDPKKWKVFQKMAVSAVELSSNRNVDDACWSMLVLQELILRPLAEIAPEMLPDCSEDTVARVYAVLNVYGLDVHAPNFGHLILVCGVTSLMEHSCIPNTHRLVDIPPVDALRPNKAQLQCRMVMRATKDIRKGENISTLIIATSMCTWGRQRILARLRKMHCRCLRCLDPRELGTDFGTLKCTKGLCAGWVLPVNTLRIDITDWKCGSCGKIYPFQDIKTLHLSLQEEIDGCRLEKNHQSVTKYKAMMKRLQTMLHPNHHFCFLVKEQWFCCYLNPLSGGSKGMARMTDDQLKRSSELGEEILRAMMNPAIVTQDLREISRRLVVMSVTNTEIAKRNKASGEWTPAYVDNILVECQNMVRRAARLKLSQFDVSAVQEHLPVELVEKMSLLMLAKKTDV